MMSTAKQYLMGNVRSFIPSGYIVIENEVGDLNGTQKIYFNILDADQNNRQLYLIVLTEKKEENSFKTFFTLNLYNATTNEFDFNSEPGPNLIPSASAVFEPHLLRIDAFTTFFQGVQRTIPAKVLSL